MSLFEIINDMLNPDRKRRREEEKRRRSTTPRYTTEETSSLFPLFIGQSEPYPHASYAFPDGEPVHPHFDPQCDPPSHSTDTSLTPSYDSSPAPSYDSSSSSSSVDCGSGGGFGGC